MGAGWRFLSGISYYTCHMANALADEYDVSAILARRLLPQRLYPGAERVGADLSVACYRDDVKCLDGVDYYLIPSIFQALSFMFRRRPDVLLFEWWSGTVLHTYLILGLAARAIGARVIVEFHEGIDTGEAELPLVNSYVDLVGRAVLRLTSGVAVHSEFDRKALSKRYGLGDKPVAVVPHGPYHYLPQSPEASNREGGQGAIEILFFGLIRPYKGLEYLIEAFDGLSEDEAQLFRLSIVGETWEGWTLPGDLVSASRYRDRITFVNRYVHDEEVAGYFHEAGVVVLPYLRSSSSGILHMAMSYGLPVIVSSVGGLPEAAAGYEGARFVEPGNAADLRSALLEVPSLAGRRYTDVHTWEHSVDVLGGLFETVCETPHSRLHQLLADSARVIRRRSARHPSAMG